MLAAAADRCLLAAGLFQAHCGRGCAFRDDSAGAALTFF
jgi:hypothetical protein